MTDTSTKDAVRSLVERPEPAQVLTKETIGGLKIGNPSSTGWINLLIYGEPGVGKTRLAASACKVPQMSPVLIADFEGGTLSLASDMPEVDIWPDPGEERRPTWKDVDTLYGALYNKNPYKTIIVDSLTETQKFAMSQIMRDVVAKDSERDPDVASLREWGKSGEQIRRMVRAFRDLPCHTIFTCLVSEDRDERTNSWKTRPGLPGKLKGEVAGYVDIVMYLYKKEVGPLSDREIKTLALTQGTERQTAKDRSGKLPAIMEAPTMAMIYDMIQGDGK